MILITPYYGRETTVRGGERCVCESVYTNASSGGATVVAAPCIISLIVLAGDITSRHPAILGLRNILKAACSNDVTSISLPLLLRHEHSEVSLTPFGRRAARRSADARSCAGDDAVVVHAARRAGAEMREGLRAGGGRLGRRRAADAALPAAARHARRPVHGTGAPATQHLPPVQPRQGQAALRRHVIGSRERAKEKRERTIRTLHSTVYLSNVNSIISTILILKYPLALVIKFKTVLYYSFPILITVVVCEFPITATVKLAKSWA